MNSSGRVIVVGSHRQTAPLARVLRRAGLSVTTTTSPEQLVQRLSGTSPPFDSVCLLDAFSDPALGALLQHTERLQPGLTSVVAVDSDPVSGRRAFAAGATLVTLRGDHPATICAVTLRAAELARLRRAYLDTSCEEIVAENVRLRAGVEEARATVRRYERDLRGIEQAASTINTTADLDQVLLEICRAAVELFGVDHSGLVVFDETGDSGTVQAEFPSRGAIGTRISVRGVPAEERLVYERAPIVLNHLTDDDGEDLGGVADTLSHLGIRSILIVPIISGGRVIGSFSLDGIEHPRNFTDEDVELCRIFAAQIAAALDKARLRLSERRKASQLELLRYTTLAMTSEHNPQRLLKTIVSLAVDLLQANGGGIYTYDPQHCLLKLQAAHGHNDAILGAQLRHSEGMAGMIIAGGLPFLIVPDYPSWPQRAGIYAEDCPFESVIAVPLHWDGRTLGVLFVDAERGRVFTAHDAGLLRFFADHAAIALEHATLLRASEAAQLRIEHMIQAVDAIFTAIAAGGPLDRQLHTILRHAAQTLDATEVRLSLPDPAQPGADPLVIAYQSIADPAPDTILPPDRPAPLAADNTTTLEISIPLVADPDAGSLLSGTLQVRNRQAMPERTNHFSGIDQQLLQLYAHAVSAAWHGSSAATHLARHDWQLLLDALPGAVIVNNRAGAIVAATERAAALLGQLRPRLIGLPAHSIYADLRASHRLIRQLLDSPTGRVVEEATLRATDNELIPARLTVTRIIGADGQDHGALSVLEDLRSLHAAEGQLRLLMRISHLITSADGLPEALRGVGECLVASFHVAFCRIYLRDQRGGLVLQAAEAAGGVSWRPGLGETIQASGVPWLAAALEHREPKVIGWRDAADWLSPWGRRLEPPGTPVILLLMPLIDQGDLAGLIEVGRLGEAAEEGFTLNEQRLIAEIAQHIAPLIERFRLQERTEYHRIRMAELEHAAGKFPVNNAPALLHDEVVRLAVEILQQSFGVLYTVRPQLGELEISAVCGLPPTLIGRRLAIDDGLAGQVAGSGQPATGLIHLLSVTPDGGDDLNATALAVPINHHHETSLVLLVGGIQRPPALIDIDLSALVRFATQAAAALQTARILGREQQRTRWANLRCQLSRFCQEASDEEQILHAFLTVVTAEYGLRFNRAALFFLNDQGDALIGRMAVGHLTPDEARSDWATWADQRAGRDFQADLDLLRRGHLPTSPLFERLDRMPIPVMHEEPSLLLDVLIHPRTLQLSAADLEDLLPAALAAVLRPGGPAVVAPLVAADRVQGILLVDNAFTQTPIHDDDCEALQAFAQTAAVASRNRRLLSEYAATSACLNALMQQPREPEHSAAGDPDQVLHVAADKIHRLMQALWVNIFLINEIHEVSRAVSSRNDFQMRADPIRKDGISIQVLESGDAQIFAQTELYRDRLQPIMFKRGAGAAVCLPLTLGVRRIGVVWIHWTEARPCLQAEIQALRLYLNQVAVTYDHACRIRVLEQIRRAAESVAAAESRQTVIEQVARYGCGLLRGSAALVWSYDAQERRIVPERSAAFNLTPEVWSHLQRQPPLAAPAMRQALEKRWFAESDVASAAGQIALGPTIGWLLHRTNAFAVQMVGLQVGGEMRGVLMVLYNRPQTFTSEDRETAELFGNYAAMVLRQADLLETLRHANCRLDTARETVKLVTSASTLENLEGALSSIVVGTRHLLSADTVVIYACNPDHRYLTIPPVFSGVRERRNVAQKPWVLRDSLVTLAMEQKEAITLDDVGTDPRFSISHFVRREGIVSCAASPLIYGDLCVGALFVSYRRPHAFTDEDRGHLNVLANQAAIVIRNEQLFREWQRRVTSLEAIQRAGQVVTSGLVRDALGRAPLENTLKRIVEQAQLLLAPEMREGSLSHLTLVEGTALRITAAYPAVHLERLQRKLGHIDLADPIIGITGRAVQLKRTLRVDHVAAEPHYLCYDPAVNAQLAVPIILGERVIGVINLEHPRECAFNAEDERALQALADYAASAIQNARLYTCLETVDLITRRVVLDATIDDLLADLCRQLQRTNFPGCLITIRQRDMDEPTPCLIFDPAWSSGGVGGDKVRQPFGVGICGYVAQHRVPVNCRDVFDQPETPQYVELSPKPFVVRSELCVPILWDEDELFGVVDVQSPRPDSFAHDDLQLLEIVAAQVAMALQNSRNIKALQSMRGVVGGRAALDWMRTVVAIWRHEIDDYTNNIRQQVFMAQKLRPVEKSIEAWMDVRLGEIEANAQRILAQMRAPVLGAYEDTVEVNFDELITTLVRDLWQQARYRDALPAPDLALHAGCMVRVNPELARIAVEMLVRNAVEAMEGLAVQQLRIVTGCNDRIVEVQVHDTGRGIPPDIRRLLFREQIIHPKRGPLRGTGLLMVRAIMEAYGGSVEVARSDERGTVMLLALPGTGSL